MKKIYTCSLILLFLFGMMYGAKAQCPPCPNSFNFADSSGCNLVDLVRGPLPGAGYQNFLQVNACKNSRVKYNITVDPVCFPLIYYSFVSISGGTLVSLVNNQLVIQWGGSNTGNVSIAFSIPAGAGSVPCSDTLNISFNLVNTPIAAFTSSPQPACFNNPTNINFNSSGSVNAINYFWDFGDGFTSTQANPVHPYATPGTYTVTLTVSNSAGGGNGQPPCLFCVDSVKHTVTINNLPGPDITCVASVCAGGTGKYCTGASGCSQYNWTVTGGTITSGQNTPCITVLWGSGSPQGTINLIVTGCPAAACPQGTTVTIPIVPLVGTITGPPSPVCVNTSAFYTLPYWPGTVYNWTLSGGGTIAPYNTNTGMITINWTAAGNWTISCNYYDSSLKCGGTASLIVGVRPIMKITGLASICQYGNSTLSSALLNNTPVPANWTISPSGPTITSGNGSPTININWPTSGIFTVTATSIPPNAVCSPATYTVTVLAAPILTSINGPDSICPNQVSVYSVTSNSTGPFSWFIINGAPTFLGANNDSVQIAWAPGGPYIINVFQVSFPNNCTSNSLSKTVFPYPTPNITGPISVCADNTETYTITNIASGNFQWSVYPPSFGTIISGQGTASVQIKWHGNNNPGFSNIVHLYFGVCNADSIAITINEPPIPVITASGTLCAGGVTLSTGATGTFTWTCTEHAIVPTPGNTPSIIVGLYGHYHVQIQNYNGTGCTVTANYFVPNTGAPVAHISANNVLNYCLPNVPNMQLIANNAGYTSFDWFLGNVLVQSGPSPVYNVNTINLPGTYSYHVVVHLGTCTDTSNVITITIANCPPVLPGPCSQAAITVTNITGCNPFTLTVAATAPAGAIINTPPNPTITHQEDGSTVNSFTTHTFATTGYKQVTICADILLTNSTVCRACKDTVVLVNAAPNFTYNIGCGVVSFYDASTTIFPAVINTYTWQIGTNPGNFPVLPIIASFNANNIPNPVMTVTQSGSYIISLTIKVGACNITHMDTLNISVPNADFNVANSCVGTLVNLNNNFAAPTNFWDFGDAATSYTSPAFHSYGAPGNYNITHIVTDANGCRDTVIKIINIVAAPVCTITYSGPTTFCFKDSLILKACLGFTNYQWYNNGVAIAGATTSADTARQTGNYSFTAINGSGCRVVSDTVAVTVNQLPSAVIVTTGSVCAGSNFFAAVQPCTGCFYQWLVDGNPASNASQVSGVAGTAPFTIGTHIIKVFVTNPTGCTDTSSVTRTFYALPLVGITVAPNPPLLCSNNVYTLTAVTNAASPSYAWYYNNYGPAFSFLSQITASADGSYTVTVTDGVTGCSASKTKIILPSPDLNLFPIGCDTLCDTSHLFIPLPSLNGNLAGYTINWYDNAPPYITVLATGPSFPLNLLGVGNHNISVIVTAPNGCKDTSNIYSVYIKHCTNVVAVTELLLTVRQVGSYALLNWRTNRETDNDHFIAERSTDGIHFSYAGTVMSKGNSDHFQYYNLYDPITVYNQTQYYRVRAVDRNGLSFNSAIVMLNPVKVQQESMLAIPNITSGRTEIILQSNSFVKTWLIIYSTEGKEIRRLPVTLQKGANDLSLNLGGMAPGFYLVAVATNEKRLTVPVIKQ